MNNPVNKNMEKIKNICASMLLLGVCCLPLFCLCTGCGPNKGTATNQITGAFGFVLGEKFTNSPYGRWGPGADGKGGFASYASADSDNQELPFVFSAAYADESGSIYSISSSNKGHLLSSDVLDLCKATLETLEKKYPLYHYDVKSSEWVFGDDKRSIKLKLIPATPIVWITYTDEDLQ